MALLLRVQSYARYRTLLSSAQTKYRTEVTSCVPTPRKVQTNMTKRFIKHKLYYYGLNK